MTAAMAELMIDGKDKSVGGTSVNADAAIKCGDHRYRHGIPDGGDRPAYSRQ